MYLILFNLHILIPFNLYILIPVNLYILTAYDLLHVSQCICVLVFTHATLLYAKALLMYQ